MTPQAKAAWIAWHLEWHDRIRRGKSFDEVARHITDEEVDDHMKAWAERRGVAVKIKSR